MLSVLQAIGILSRNSRGNWAVSRIGQNWLLETEPSYMGELFERAEKLLSAYRSLDHVLLHDEPVEEMLAETKAAFGKNRDTTNAFFEMMGAMSRALAREILSNTTIDSPKYILDMGCGDATISIELLRTFPDARIDAVDLPGVIDLARENAQQARIKRTPNFHGSDWRNWKTSRTYDLVILSHVLHEEREQDAELLMGRCGACLNDGGQLWIIGFLEKCPGKSILLHHIFRLNLLVELGSDNTTIKWIRETTSKLHISEIELRQLQGGRHLWRGKKLAVGKEGGAAMP